MWPDNSGYSGWFNPQYLNTTTRAGRMCLTASGRAVLAGILEQAGFTIAPR